MKHGMYLQDDNKTLLVSSTRQLLVLSQKDIEHAVVRDFDVYMRALKRGKNELRCRKNEERYEKWKNQGKPTQIK